MSRPVPGWSLSTWEAYARGLRRLADQARLSDPDVLRGELQALADQANPDRLRRDILALAEDARYGPEVAQLVREAGAPLDLDDDSEPLARDPRVERELAAFAAEIREGLAEEAFQKTPPSPRDRLVVKVTGVGQVATRISPATAARRHRERLERERQAREAREALTASVQPHRARGLVVRPGHGIFTPSGVRVRGNVRLRGVTFAENGLLVG